MATEKPESKRKGGGGKLADNDFGVRNAIFGQRR